MSTPDPKTVRDFARRAILSSAEDVDYCGIGEQFGDEEAWPNEEAAYGAMLDAVYAEQQKATVTVEWPDEQQPADVVTAEQQQDGAAEELRTFLDALPPRIDIVAGWTRNGVRTELTAEALRAVLAERTALAARVAELESEREADTRAVVTLLRFGYVPSEGNWMTDAEAVGALRARFMDRSAAQTVAETEES